MIGPEIPPRPVAAWTVILVTLFYGALLLLFILGGFNA